MKTKIKLGLLALLAVLFAMLPVTQAQAADRLQARYDIENCYEGDLQSIKVTILNTEPGETFTYRWKYHTFAGWTYWGASGNWYSGGESDTITFQTELGEATCDWEDEWGWLEHGVEIKSSTGRKLTIESIYRPQPMLKYSVYTIIFTGLEEPKVGQKLDYFVESFADYAFEPLGIIWYRGWDDSTTDGYVGPDTIVTSGKYRCRLYFDMVSPYKLGDGANAAINYSNGIIKYDSEIEKYYILKTYTAIELTKATISKQPVSTRGSLSTGATLSIKADNVKTYHWQLYRNGSWYNIADSNTDKYTFNNGTPGDYTLRCKLTSVDDVTTYSNTVGVTIYDNAKVSQSAKFVYEGEAVDFAVTNVGCSAEVSYYEWLWTNDKIDGWELCENYEEYFDDDYKYGKLKLRYALDDFLALHPKFICRIFFKDGLGVIESQVVGLKPYYEARNGIETDSDGKLKYFKNDEIVTSYTGLVYSTSHKDWFYVEKGIVNFDFTGVTDYNGTIWYVKYGMLDKSINGLNYISGQWYYFNAGKVDTKYVGLAYKNSVWWYVKNGTIDKTYTGLVYYEEDWWYVTNGQLDKSYKGITYMNNDYWFVKDGKISKTSGIWEQDGNIYYVVNGKVDKSVTNLIYHNGTWYYFRNGIVDWSYNTLAYANNEWWYVNHGVLDKSYTGLVLFREQLWYVKEGKLDKTFVGNVTYNGKTYHVENGIGTLVS